MALLDRSVRHHGSIDDRESAQYAPGAEPLRQNADMTHSVQHGYDHALLAHCRSNRVHSAIKVVGLAGEQNDTVGPVQFALLDSPDLGVKFAAVLQFDDQSMALQLGRARWPHEKCNVGPTLEEHSAEISSERARAQY